MNANTIWSGFGGSCQTRNDGDPIALYELMADRWLIAQFTAANPYGECVAISTSPDPTGSYYRYFFQLSTTVFYDYPHLGVWPDGYYMGANRFTGNTYSGGAAIVFNRANMLQGLASTYQAFNTSTTYGTLLPSDLRRGNITAERVTQLLLLFGRQQTIRVQVPCELDDALELYSHRAHYAHDSGL